MTNRKHLLCVHNIWSFQQDDGQTDSTELGTLSKTSVLAVYRLTYYSLQFEFQHRIKFVSEVLQHVADIVQHITSLTVLAVKYTKMSSLVLALIWLDRCNLTWILWISLWSYSFSRGLVLTSELRRLQLLHLQRKVIFLKEAHKTIVKYHVVGSHYNLLEVIL